MPDTSTSSPAPSVAEVLAAFRDLGDELRSVPGDGLAAVAQVAVLRVPAADRASITLGRDGRFWTVAATDDRAQQADEVQYELGSGPCVDAIVDDTVYDPGDVAEDDRWPEYGRRIAEQGVRSMLSYRLVLMDEAQADTIGGLNLYSDTPHAFDDADLRTGQLLATHGAVMASAAGDRARAEHLQQALLSNREIGVAMGILMARHTLTRDQAFDLLKLASQHTNRKLRDVATEVADTGTLELPAPRARAHRDATGPRGHGRR
ncbi:GAF and ANTAR domain-containing protein [Angustibacter aerolatus]